MFDKIAVEVEGPFRVLRSLVPSVRISCLISALQLGTAFLLLVLSHDGASQAISKSAKTPLPALGVQQGAEPSTAADLVWKQQLDLCPVA